jgi:hypothetical protein
VPPTVPPTPTLEESVMKLLSIRCLTRVLPASIALGGLAALVGCMNPPVNPNNPDASVRRGSMFGASSGTAFVQNGGAMQPGTIVQTGGPGQSGGVVQAGGAIPPGSVILQAGDDGRRGGLFSGSGGGTQVAQAGGFVDGSDGGGQRGSLFGGFNGFSGGTSCSDGSCGSGGTGYSGRGSLYHSGSPCDTVPPGALPAQLGASVRAYHKVQKENADLDKYIIYPNEWYMNGTDLGPWGRNHVYLLAKRLKEVNVPVPVTVYASPEGQLNDIRRVRVVEYLTRLGVPGDVDARVQVGFPEAVDLDGNEATRIYYQMLIPNQYQNNGFGGSSYGNFGTFGNGAFGSGFGGGSGGGFGGFGGFGGGGFGRPFGF